MFNKLTIAKAIAKAAASSLPEGSKVREVFSRLETIKPEELGVAGKELLAMGAGKGRSLVAELAQKTADALSEQPAPADHPPVEVVKSFVGQPHELVIGTSSHIVTVEAGVIVVTSSDYRTQTRLTFLAPSGGCAYELHDAINLRLHQIVMGEDPK